MFGDSWAQGSELRPGEKTFGQLVSMQLGFDYFTNYSEPSASISHLIVQLKNFLINTSAVGKDPSKFIALFFLTTQDRSMNNVDGEWIFYSGGDYGISDDRQRAFAEASSKYYWKYFHNRPQQDIITNVTILSLQSICAHHGIQDFYLAGWEQFNLWPEVSSSKIYKDGKIHCGNLFGIDINQETLSRADKGPYLNPGGHPNQKGHQLIADQLVEWIVNEK